jgi:hypothetical protein
MPNILVISPWGKGEKHIMGRVNSIIPIFLNNSSPVMAFIYGLLTNYFPLPNMIIGIGIFGILLSLSSFFV